MPRHNERFALVRRLGIGLAGAALAIGVAACTWQGLHMRDDGPVRLFLVGELTHVDDRAIVAAASPYLDADFFELDLDGLREAVAREPWVAAVRVHRRWPNGVVIRVREHRPVALWNDGAVLAADGELFAPAGDGRPAGLPRLSGPEGSEARLWARFPALRDALSPSGRTIARLRMDPRGAWEAVLDNGLVLRLGRSDIESRVRRFAVHAATAPDGRLADAGYVDLRYDDGFALGGTRAKAADEGGDNEQAA